MVVDLWRDRRDLGSWLCAVLGLCLHDDIQGSYLPGREPMQAITEDIQLIKDRGQRYRATRAFYTDLTFPLLHVRGFLPPHFNGTGEGANPWGGDYIIEPSRDGTKLVVIATYIPDEVKDQLTQAIGIDTACSAVPGVGEDLDQCNRQFALWRRAEWHRCRWALGRGHLGAPFLLSDRHGRA